jgi:protein-S-isoprenylcysteine O-methyltransferase Ste14
VRQGYNASMTQSPSIHLTLAHSYLAYFVFSLLGLFADTFFSFGLPLYHGQWIALSCFALGPLLIWWAQKTSGNKKENPYFQRGPYRLMRNPTHIGILILVAGYTAISGSIVFLAVTVLGYVISNIFFKKYESLLHTKYGTQYGDYKKSVPKIF